MLPPGSEDAVGKIEMELMALVKAEVEEFKSSEGELRKDGVEKPAQLRESSAIVRRSIQTAIDTGNRDAINVAVVITFLYSVLLKEFLNTLPTKNGVTTLDHRLDAPLDGHQDPPPLPRPPK